LVSNVERPEFQALTELERVLQHVKDELASWRRRALKAEAHRAEMGMDHDVVATRERIRELELENEQVNGRLQAARTRVDDLLTRLKFLEEQVRLEEQAR
jgi:predicted nuclease with TOPRIM domain